MNFVIDSFGMRVYENPLLPIAPSAGEDARRMVRHGLSDVLRWLGEGVGPGPGALTHAIIVDGNLHASAEVIERIRASAAG